MPLSRADVLRHDAFDDGYAELCDGSTASCGSSSGVAGARLSPHHHRCWVFMYAPMPDGSMLPDVYLHDDGSPDEASTPAATTSSSTGSTPRCRRNPVPVPLVLDGYQLHVATADVPGDGDNNKNHVLEASRTTPTDTTTAAPTTATSPMDQQHIIYMPTIRRCKGSLVYGHGFELGAPTGDGDDAGALGGERTDEEVEGDGDDSDVEGRRDAAVLSVLDAVMNRDLYERHLFICREPKPCELMEDEASIPFVAPVETAPPSATSLSFVPMSTATATASNIVSERCDTPRSSSGRVNHPTHQAINASSSPHAIGPSAPSSCCTVTTSTSSPAAAATRCHASDVMHRIAECRKRVASSLTDECRGLTDAAAAAYFRVWVYQAKRSGMASSSVPPRDLSPRGGRGSDRMSLSSCGGVNSRSGSQLTTQDAYAATTAPRPTAAPQGNSIGQSQDDGMGCSGGPPLLATASAPRLRRAYNGRSPADVVRLWRAVLPWVPSWYYTQALFDDTYERPQDAAGEGTAVSSLKEEDGSQRRRDDAPSRTPNCPSPTIPRHKTIDSNNHTNNSSRRTSNNPPPTGALPLTCDGNVWYFAFGSNMSERQCIRRLGQHRGCHPARLLGHRLLFDKPSTAHAAVAYANIRPVVDTCDDGGGNGVMATTPVGAVSDAVNVVYGVLYLLHPSQLRTMDGYEVGYQRKVVHVDLLGSYDGDGGGDAVVDTVSAITYMAAHRSATVVPSVLTLLGSHVSANPVGDFVLDATTSHTKTLYRRLPTREYLSTILEGSPRLPRWYATWLAGHPTLPSRVA